MHFSDRVVNRNRHKRVYQRLNGSWHWLHELGNGLHQTRVVISFEQLLAAGAKRFPCQFSDRRVTLGQEKQPQVCRAPT